MERHQKSNENEVKYKLTECGSRWDSACEIGTLLSQPWYFFYLRSSMNSFLQSCKTHVCLKRKQVWNNHENLAKSTLRVDDFFPVHCFSITRSFWLGENEFQRGIDVPISIGLKDIDFLVDKNSRFCGNWVVIVVVLIGLYAHTSSPKVTFQESTSRHAVPYRLSFCRMLAYVISE